MDKWSHGLTYLSYVRITDTRWTTKLPTVCSAIVTNDFYDISLRHWFTASSRHHLCFWHQVTLPGFNTDYDGQLFGPYELVSTSQTDQCIVYQPVMSRLSVWVVNHVTRLRVRRIVFGRRFPLCVRFCEAWATCREVVNCRTRLLYPP